MIKEFRCYIKSAITAVVALFSYLVVGCSEDAETAFARHDAFLRVPNVSTLHPLHSALNSPGVFCQITFTATHYQYLNNYGRYAEMPRTALDAYGAPRYISGFIVGTPNAVLNHAGTTQPMAFDLVCPSCFNKALIQRKLSISDTGKAFCSRCETTYNLNIGGYPESGPGQDKMLQYHMQYGSDILVINN